MWAGKWLIGSILTGENIVKNAMLRSAYYVGGKTGNYILPDYMEKHPTIDKMAGCAGWCRCFS